MAKRGRPPKKKIGKDLGTAELQMKRIFNLTYEPLDLCMRRQIITLDQQQAAMRLRWLYTLRYGAPSISAYDPQLRGTAIMREDDPRWLEARRAEYESAICDLSRINARQIVVNICIFNQMPEFLLPYANKINAKEAKKRNDQLSKLREGLEILSEKMGKRNKREVHTIRQ